MTKNEKYIVDMYVRYFGRAADAATIKSYAEDKKTSVILKNIIADADAEKAQLDTADFVNNAFQNLFGRDATTKEMNKYSKVVEKGKDLPINSIVKSAAKTDKAVYDNKIAVAAKYAELGGKGDLDLSKISKGNTVELNFLNTVTKAADLKAKIETLADNNGIASSFDGKTFVLTTSVDTGKDFVGTAKNDLFVASDVNVGGTMTPTWSVADTIDGGIGIDGLTIVTKGAVGTADFASNTMKSIEIVDITTNDTSKNIDLDTTKAGKVAENFKAVTDLKLTASGATSTITVVGGKNIVAKATGLIKIDEDADAKTAATIEKITIDGLAANSTIGTAAYGVDALKELTVKNGLAASTATLDVTTAVETLKVNFDNSLSTGAITLTDAKLKTLNVDASGKESTVEFDTTSTILETINISGNAKLTLETGSTVAAAASGVKEINVTNTKGVVITDALGINTKFTGGTGADSVVLGATTKAISMGAGDDTVKLTAGINVLGTGGSVDAGAGKDTISMDATDAVTISGKVDGKFNGTFSNFEVLEITDTAAAGSAAAINAQKINNVNQVNIATAGAFTGKIDDLVNNGTVKVTDVTGGQAFAVNLKDIGLGLTTDVLNLEVSSNAAIIVANASTVTATGVETININSDDAKTTATGIAHAFDVIASHATSIVVTGDAGLTTSATTSAVKLTSFDASASTGAVIFASDSTTNVTIKGGAGNDDLKGGTQNDTIIGGAGDDILAGAGGVDTLTGGAGKDKFVITAQNTTTVGIDKITDFVGGVDKIKIGVANADALTDLRATDFSASASVAAAATNAIAAGATTANDVVLFTYQSKVYAAVNKAADSVFTEGTDVIVDITGVTGTVTAADFIA